MEQPTQEEREWAAFLRAIHALREDKPFKASELAGDITEGRLPSYALPTDVAYADVRIMSYGGNLARSLGRFLGAREGVQGSFRLVVMRSTKKGHIFRVVPEETPEAQDTEDTCKTLGPRQCDDTITHGVHIWRHMGCGCIVECPGVRPWEALTGVIAK